jgi:hypothetical protein
MTETPNRQPARVPQGTPTGGEFAATSHAESDTSLDAEPATYFHGTDARLDPGDVLVPGAEIGRRNFGEDFNAKGGGNERVYLTDDPVNAFDWAMQGAARGRSKRARVYQVRAEAQPTARDGEYVAPRAVVVRDVTNG